MNKIDKEVKYTAFDYVKNDVNPALIGSGYIKLNHSSNILPNFNKQIVLYTTEYLKEMLPYITGIKYSSDYDNYFDFVLLENLKDVGNIENFFSRCSNPSAPVISLSDDFGPRADLVLQNLSKDSLVSALFSLRSLHSRLYQLPPIPFGLDRNGLTALALAYTRNCTIEACWQRGELDAIGYPILRGMSNARSVLQELADAGLMRRRFFERLHLCRHCGSSQVHAREVCVSCHSSNIAEHSLLHHYACGHQASEAAFEHRNGYVCPKCRKQLRHYGVDYDKPGLITTCKGCGTTMAEPEVGFTCVSCSEYTPSEQSETRDWYHYELLPDGLAALRAGELPHIGIDTAESGRYSLRDFRLIVESRLRDIRRYSRPLTAIRVTIETGELEQRLGRQGILELCEFFREIAIQNIRESDVTATVPAGLVACLSETDGNGAAIAIERINNKLPATISAAITLRVEIYEGEQISQLLQGLNR
jgi:Thaumarchaeal output domain 1